MARNDGTSYQHPEPTQGVVSGGRSYHAASTNALVKVGPGDLIGIFATSTASGSFQLFDSADSTPTTEICSTYSVSSIHRGWIPFPVHFQNGLFVSSVNLWWTAVYN